MFGTGAVFQLIGSTHRFLQIRMDPQCQRCGLDSAHIALQSHLQMYYKIRYRSLGTIGKLWVVELSTEHGKYNYL